MNPQNPNFRKPKTKSKDIVKQKVHIILVYDKAGHSKIKLVFANRRKAEERLQHLKKQHHKLVSSGEASFHLITKSIQGRVDG